MKYVACIIAGFILCLLLTNFVCNKQSPSVEELKRKDSLSNKVFDSLKLVIKAKNDKIAIDSASFEKERQGDDSDRNNILDDKETTEQRLKNQVVALTFQRNKFRTAAEGKDTAGGFIICQEYMRQADSIKNVALGYQKIVDSLISNAKERRTIDSSERAVNYQTIGQDRQQIDSLIAIVEEKNKLIDELFKKIAKLQRNKWLWFGLGAAAGGLTGHSIK